MATVLESTPSIYNVPLRGGHLERWSTPPENSDVSAERLHRKQRLAAAFRVFARYGFDMGGAGHITVRDPENTEHFWVNPHGVWFGHIRVSDLLRVDSNGQVIEGKGALNKAAFVIHKAIHDARPDVVAAAHAHAFHGKVWSTTGRLLGPLTQDATAFYESHALYNSYSGVVLDSDEGQRIASSLGLNKALLLSNHGHLTVGKTVESAVWRFIAFENAAKAQILAESLGTPSFIEREAALEAAKLVGSEFNHWANFLPLWDRLVREEPDFLE